VVDEDIDPANIDDVIWAMCARRDPRIQADIIRGGITFNRQKTFPTIARSSKALDARMRAKWAHELPKEF